MEKKIPFKNRNTITFAQQQQQIQQKMKPVAVTIVDKDTQKIKTELAKSNQEIQGYKIYKEVMDQSILAI
jgi:hypothetical protein